MRTGGVVSVNLVSNIRVASHRATANNAQQTEQSTVRTYEYILPPGAPGGAGFHDEVCTMNSTAFVIR